jgi:urease accessory protein
MTLKSGLTALAVLMVAGAQPALAHSGHGEGFAAGFGHPFSGLDHVLAMLAVGLWAALRGGRAVWFWPAAFVGAMIAGFGLAQADVAIPRLEPMIAASVVLLGAAIAIGLRAPVWLGVLGIAIAGSLHGFAHGLEVSGSALPFAAGFALATAILHAAGIGLGVLAQRQVMPVAVRLAGAGIAAAGLVMVLA